MTTRGSRRGGKGLAVAASVLALVAVVGPSCTPIEVPAASSAPLNRCVDHPCDNYKGDLRAPCTGGRCQFTNPASFPLWVVVHVPDTNIFAPGSTFAFFSDENGAPTFKQPAATPVDERCVPPFCVKLGNIGAVDASYKVTTEASKEVGFPLPNGASIPVRVVYVPTSNGQRQPLSETLPLDDLFSSSVLVTAEEGLHATRAIPFGTYQRLLYPQPPYDEYFPPTADSQPIGANLRDDFILLGPSDPVDTRPPNSKYLDPVADGSRLTRVTREDGLDGFRVWLEDATTRRRISVVRTLSGREMEVQLYTTGENRSPSGTGLGDNVEAVVAPPDDWTAVPRYVTPLPGGAGLQNLQFPTIPPPVTVTGVIAFAPPGEAGTLRGVPSTLSFESDELATRNGTTTLLRYRTTVSTDDRGLFATILPPGNYVATIAPRVGTGFAKTRRAVVIDRTVTVLTLEPPPVTVVKGRVVLTDGRPVGDTEIIAVPDAPEGRDLPTPSPRRTTTASDGRYTLELDPGPYLVMVSPQAGSGFPRVVTRVSVPSEAFELPDIGVPPPTPLVFTVKDPTLTVNPVARAVVRVFAVDPDGRNRPVEVGMGMTGDDGTVEILLAEPPR